MVDVGPVSPGSGNFALGGNQQSVPPGPPLPIDDPWVKALATLFPNVPIGIIQTFAGSFQTNMYQAMNNQIAHDLKKAREAAQKFKESIEDNG